jgi:hypothetical protein
MKELRGNQKAAVTVFKHMGPISLNDKHLGLKKKNEKEKYSVISPPDTLYDTAKAAT